MKILNLHSNSIKVTPKKKALKSAEDIPLNDIEMKDCLVVFAATEKKDEENPEQVAETCAQEVKKHTDQINVKNVMLYPYVHLTNKPSNPRTAVEILNKTESKLKEMGFEVKQAPFGWYKAFNIDVKGHPLAELSREF